MRTFQLQRILLLFALFLVATLAHPSIQTVWSHDRVGVDLPNTRTASITDNPEATVREGRARYQAGQFWEALELWHQAERAYQVRSDVVNQAMVLSNISLAYQQLGQWTEAQAAIATSLNILKDSGERATLAQALNTQGSLLFARGQTEAALAIWQEATTNYTKDGDSTGEIRSLLNQVQALKTLGFYRRALKTLEEVDRRLQTQPDSSLKASGLRNLGDVLQVVGDLDRSGKVLQQSLEIARRISSPSDLGETLLSLGNYVRARKNVTEALDYYQQAASTAIDRATKVKAQLNQFSLLVATQDRTSALDLLPQIQSQLVQLPASRYAVYARINLVQNLTNLGNQSRESVRILATAVQQAEALDDKRAISYALGSLAGIYEQSQQLQDARELTQRALLTAQAIGATDIAYRWQWQLGRILNAQGDKQEAIAAYTEAVNNLHELRGDLVAIDPGVQFSFRESVEPVYRQLVGLLLDGNQDNATAQKNLKQAQNAIESLQLAELVNFFRADCLTANPVEIATVDRKAAVIYPIVLEDRLEVILSLPQQPLRHYATSVTQSQVDETAIDLRSNLLDASSRDYLPEAQRVYDWLIRPLAADLAQSRVKTLVFVLDGSLRNIPMATLHDGQHYLAESYSIALTPGLQLLDPKPLKNQPIAAITGGLSEARQGFSALPNVELEIKEIQAQVPSTSLLNQTFTNKNLGKVIDNSTFPIIHLATHGQFSSTATDTFLLTWDGRINIEELTQFFQTRSQKTGDPIELLILSACKTAAGDKRAALGLAGMAVRAGARSTIASLWSINDEATASFMLHLYQNLIDKKLTRADALQEAQLSLLREARFQHPYYWAPFVLLGNWL